MHTKTRLSILLLFLSLIWLGGRPGVCGQSTNAPTLSLKHGAAPVLTITGTTGANYQVQFPSQLNGPNPWTNLTNVLLNNPSFALTDSNAPASGPRFYRALLLSAPFSGYAPGQLSSGETYLFSATNAGIVSIEQLLVNSATSGVWVVPGSSPSSGLTLVSLQFTQLGPVTAALSVIFPPTNVLPSGSTNSYLLAFDSANAGLFLTQSGPGSTVGNFTRDASLLGQNLAPLQLTEGETYQLTVTNSFSTNVQTLVLNSATDGFLVTPGSSIGAGISAVTVQYSRQGPLSGSLVVVIPATSSSPSPSTNTYLLGFTGTSSGSFQESTFFNSATVGIFARNTSLEGQTLAPQQLAGGESYQLTVASSFSTNVQTLVMNSATAGSLVVSGGGIGVGISAGTVQYTRLGLLNASVVVTIPASSSSPSPTTNTFLLVYTGTNTGAFQESSMFSTTSVGSFVRNISLIGQTVAPQQLSGGETYQLTEPSQFSPTVLTIAMNSATSGALVAQTSSPGSGISTGTVQYNQLGPVTGNLVFVVPAVPPFNATTNTFLLIFTGTSSGVFQLSSAFGSPTIGNFTRDTSLVGQIVAPQQLAGGETYQLVAISAGITNSQTLVMNSATDGLFVVPGSGPGSGLFTPTVQYSLLGPLTANLAVIFPSGQGIPTPTTNNYLLVYTALNSGAYQESSGGLSSAALGNFVRSTSLVGQNLAPQQLTGGEAYQLVSTNTGSTNLHVLVLTSATNGVWTTENSSGSGNGISAATVQYSHLGPASGNLSVILPTSSEFPGGETNNVLLLFNSTAQGFFQNTSTSLSDSGSGPFIRTLP